MKSLFINNYFKNIILLFLFPINSGSYIAQIKVNVCSPVLFDYQWTDKSVKDVIREGAQCLDGNEFWIVRSIADGIITYKDKDKNAPNSTTLNYLQQFVVSEMSNDGMLHIYDFNPKGKGELFNNSKDWGWVSIYDILPSDFPESKIEDGVVFNEKAMPTYILNSQNIAKPIEEMVFYTSYDGNKPTGRKVESQIPYYVFAKRGGRYLLSKKATINVREKGDNVFLEMGGWLDENVIQILQGRVCWEPSWKKSSFDFYKDQDFYVYKEDERDIAVNFRETGGNNTTHVISSKYNPTIGRKDQKGKRSFQIKRLRSGIVKVLVRGNANEKYSNDKINKLEKELEDLKENIRKLNILFVVDGTKSMDKYMTITSDAIKSSMLEIEKMGNLSSSIVNEINFAVGVYRDNKNTKTPSYEFKQFTPSNRIHEIDSFFKNIECDSEGDKDLAEDVYNGLYESMGLFKGKENQKNVVIVIGDAGDHQTSDSEKSNHKSLEKQIIQLAEKYKVSWGFYQVDRRKGKVEYRHFMKNAKKLIAKSADNINKNTSSIKKINSIKNNHYNLYSTYLDLVYDVNDTSDIEDYIMFGYLYQPKDNDHIPEAILKDAISNAILKMHLNTKKIVRIITGGPDNPNYIKTLITYGKTKEEIELLQQMGFRIPGYLPINNVKGEDSSENAMCKVIMMTPGEFRDQKRLLLALVKASESEDASTVSAQLIDVLTDKMIQVTGNSGSKDLDKIKDQMMDYELNNVWLSFFGKEFTYDQSKGSFSIR